MKSCKPTKGIWALGDCNGRGAFTHTSYNDDEIVADNLLNADDRRVSRPNPDVRFVYRSAARPMRHDGRRNTEVSGALHSRRNFR